MALKLDGSFLHGRVSVTLKLKEADSYRMLKRMVDGDSAQLDDGDHFTRAGEP